MVDSVTLAELGADWLDHSLAEGKLASTMHGYTYAINGILLPWCEREGIEDVAELDQAALNRLNRELLARRGRKGEPISKYTIDAYLRPIRHFLKWAAEDGADVRGLPLLPKGKRRQPKDVLTREEIQRMEDATPNERDKLIVRLLADTGMRIGELVKLRPEDVVERDRRFYLYVRGKGENDRYVPIPRVHRRLQRWIDRGRPQPCADAIFVALRQTDGFYEALRYSGAYEVVRGAALMARIGKRVHPHLLRHSLITHLRRQGRIDPQISLVVGNFTALGVYTHMDAADAYGIMSGLD